MRSTLLILLIGFMFCLSSTLLAQEKSQRPSLKPPADPKVEPFAKAATETETIKLETVLVNVPVLVMDRDGKFLPNLTQQQFRVYEDDVEQVIDAFAPVEAPFNVVLLLDTSGSTQLKLEEIQKAALAFVEALRPQDSVMVVSFDRRVYVDCEFTSDRNQLRRAILRTRTGGMTRLYDAVNLVMTERLNKLTGRKAIVLFTDGVDMGSNQANALTTLTMLEEADILVYPIWYDTKPSLNSLTRSITVSVAGSGETSSVRFFDPEKINSDYERGAAYLRELAERTGARHYQAATIPDLKKAFAAIADELRYQYFLSYYPTNSMRDGAFRRVRVRVTEPDAVVRTRNGYSTASKP